MKNYLIVDCMGDYTELADYKDIKDLLIGEVVQNLYNNISDKSLEDENLKNIWRLERLAREKDTPLSYIEKELEAYSFKIIDLLSLQRDLEDVRGYFLNKNNYVDDVCEDVIDKINKVVSGGE